MHYPRKVSRIKKIRKQGFRARMRTPGGRKLLNRQRRKGRHSLSVFD
jgi:large subunit ribosomal protein L34